jgi:hypothetical protein
MKLTPGLSVESYIRAAIADQIKSDLKGRLVRCGLKNDTYL